MIGEKGITGSLGITGSVGITGSIGIGAFGGGGGSILPPIRPDSYLKYSFTQEPTQSIIDRVDSSKQLTTTIGTDVNAPQTKTGEIQTFNPLQQAFDVSVGAFIEPSGVNLLPASFLNWTGTTGVVVGQNLTFTNDTGFGEAIFTIDSGLQRAYARAQAQYTAGENTLSAIVLEAGVIPIPPSQVILPAATGVATSTYVFKVNNVVVPISTPYNFEADDVISMSFFLPSALTAQARYGLGTSTGSTLIDGMSIKLTRPQVESGTQRSSFIQPNGAPAQRDPSTPQVPATNVPDDIVAIYANYINNATASQNNPVNIAITEFNNDSLIIAYTYEEIPSLAPANSFIVTTGIGSFGITLTPSQAIEQYDEIELEIYNSGSVITLIYKNKTKQTVEFLQESQSISLGSGQTVYLGQEGFIAANYMTLIDFEVTAYTAPVLPQLTYWDSPLIANGDDLKGGGSLSNVNPNSRTIP
ncbi:MAG: hypothetical protein GY918_06720, partial [Gammaproteobacteria bacterium]|nr:hypothetical protein [Gammaproteobacteria bacterium]